MPDVEDDPRERAVRELYRLVRPGVRFGGDLDGNGNMYSNSLRYDDEQRTRSVVDAIIEAAKTSLASKP